MTYKTKNFNKSVKVVFHLIILLVTIILITDCLRQYALDEDATKVAYQRFNENEHSNYPSVTYCTGYPIRWGEIWESYGNDEVSKIRNEYMKYISGDNTEIKFSDLDYDKVTVKLEDFLHTITAELSNNIRVNWQRVNGTSNFKLQRAFKHFRNENSEYIEEDLGSEEEAKMIVPKMYISHRSRHKKCYTIDIPNIRNEKILFFKLYINPNIFPKFGSKGKNMIRAKEHQTHDLQGVSNFSIYFNYPNQSLKAVESKSGFIPKIEEARYYARKYYLSYFEVLRRRNKPRSTCLNGNYDEQIMHSLISEFECKPPTVLPGRNVTNCSKYHNTLFQNALMKNDHIAPCNWIHSISIRDGEENQIWFENRDNIKPQMMIDIHFDDEYFKQTKYVKDYTIISLIGHMGGYIGKQYSILLSILHNHIISKVFLESNLDMQ